MGNTNYVKYQHYVPRVYLRNFSEDKNHIYCFDKIRNTSERKLIDDVAGEKYFYDIKLSELKNFVENFNLDINVSNLTQETISGPQELERFLAENIESTLFGSIQDVIDFYSNNQPIAYNVELFSDGIKYCWSLLAVYQFFRTKSHRKNLSKMLNKGNEGIINIMQQYERTHNINCSEQIKEIKQSNHELSIRKLQNDFLLDVKHMKGMANIHFYGYKWLIGVSTNKEFYTSDNPCLFASRYQNPASELYFPISSNLCFILKRKDDPYGTTLKDKSFFRCGDILVDYINKLIIDSADRIVLTKEKEDILKNYDLIEYKQREMTKSLFLYPDGKSYITLLNEVQLYPYNIQLFLNNNGFNQIGSDTPLKSRLLFINFNTRCFRFGYFGMWYGGPINNKIYDESEIVDLINKFLLK